MPDQPLRVVTFNMVPVAYNMMTRWIAETGNKHVLTVTTPGSSQRQNTSYREMVNNAPRQTDILITTRLRTVATPLIRALEPDLIMCFGFPFLLTPEILSIPKIGAVNLHPAVLPAYRGPNVFRMFYESAPEYGVTIHWMSPDFDTGNILAQSRSPMPEKFDMNAVMQDWITKGYQALCEGMEKAIAGDEGIPQDDSKATYAALFTEEERWLDWHDTCDMLARKHCGLAFSNEAQGRIEGESYSITSLEVLSDYEESGNVGDVLSRDGDSLVIQVGDGAVQVTIAPLEESTEE